MLDVFPSMTRLPNIHLKRIPSDRLRSINDAGGGCVLIQSEFELNRNGMMKVKRMAIAVFGTVLCMGLSSSGIADEDSQSVIQRSVEADFADVRIDIDSAIMNGGYVVDYQANIGDMLKRTAADVGSTETVYLHAETWQFCSSILSRATMEANPANIAHCPYVIFAYETEASPGQVVVGFRTHSSDSDSSSDASLVAVDKALTEVIEEATE